MRDKSNPLIWPNDFVALKKLENQKTEKLFLTTKETHHWQVLELYEKPEDQYLI